MADFFICSVLVCCLSFMLNLLAVHSHKVPLVLSNLDKNYTVSGYVDANSIAMNKATTVAGHTDPPPVNMCLPDAVCGYIPYVGESRRPLRAFVYTCRNCPEDYECRLDSYSAYGSYVYNCRRKQESTSPMTTTTEGITVNANSTTTDDEATSSAIPTTKVEETTFSADSTTKVEESTSSADPTTTTEGTTSSADPTTTSEGTTSNSTTPTQRRGFIADIHEL